MTVFLHQLALTSQWFHSDAAVIIWCHFKLQMKSLQLGTCILSNTYVAVSIVSFQVAHTNKNWGRIKWLNSLHFTCHDFSPSYHHLLDSQSQLIHTLLMYLLGVSFCSPVAICVLQFCTLQFSGYDVPFRMSHSTPVLMIQTPLV